MIEALNFVRGAISKNGISPELEHFIIRDGRVTGFNGYMALSAPIPLAIDAQPKAGLFHKALQACGEKVAINMTDGGRLHIKSEGLSAYIQCYPDKVVYEAKPSGTKYECPPGLLDAFKRIYPLIGDDASRPWAMGMGIGNGSYMATNNIILIQLWDGHQLPTFNCPRFAVAEVVRNKEQPTHIQLDDHSVTFHYEDGRWLRSQLLEQDWPMERVAQIMERPSTQTPVPDWLFEAVGRLAPFTEGPSSPIYLNPQGAGTSPYGQESGVWLDHEGMADTAIFRLKSLQLLENEMKTIDFSMYPQPCIFMGDNSRGALIGMEL